MTFFEKDEQRRGRIFRGFGEKGAKRSLRGRTDPNPFRYCGEYFDFETGEYYLRARSYDPTTGRLTAEDIVKDGGNWYNYCNGNPIKNCDPSGKSSGPITYDQLPHHLFTEDQFNFWNTKRFKFIKPAELALAAYNPLQMIGMNKASKSANYLTELFYGAEAPDGTADNAFNHACGAAIMSNQHGQYAALMWTYAHETYYKGFDFDADVGDGHTYAEHIDMDLYNDYYGTILPDLPDEATMISDLEAFLAGLNDTVTIEQACENGNVSVTELWYILQIKQELKRYRKILLDSLVKESL